MQWGWWHLLSAVHNALHSMLVFSEGHQFNLLMSRMGRLVGGLVRCKHTGSSTVLLQSGPGLAVLQAYWQQHNLVAASILVTGHDCCKHTDGCSWEPLPPLLRVHMRVVRKLHVLVNKNEVMPNEQLLLQDGVFLEIYGGWLLQKHNLHTSQGPCSGYLSHSWARLVGFRTLHVAVLLRLLPHHHRPDLLLLLLLLLLVPAVLVWM